MYGKEPCAASPIKTTLPSSLTHEDGRLSFSFQTCASFTSDSIFCIAGAKALKHFLNCAMSCLLDILSARQFTLLW